MSDMDKAVQSPEPGRATSQKPVITRRLDAATEAPNPRPRRPETVKLNMDADVQAGSSVPAARLGLTRDEIVNAMGILRRTASAGDRDGARVAVGDLAGLLEPHTSSEERSLFAELRRDAEFTAHVDGLCAEHREALSPPEGWSIALHDPQR